MAKFASARCLWTAPESDTGQWHLAVDEVKIHDSEEQALEICPSPLVTVTRREVLMVIELTAEAGAAMSCLFGFIPAAMVKDGYSLISRVEQVLSRSTGVLLANVLDAIEKERIPY